MSAVETGKRIAELLKQNAMSQRELAARVGATESAVSKYVKGDRVPRAEVLANIATALHTTSEYLLDIQRNELETEFGTIKSMCARHAPDMSEEQRNDLIMTILAAAGK